MNSRPATVRDVALQAETLRDFGHLCQDWLHTLRKISSRNAAAAAIHDEPPLLRGRFHQGEVADAWLAAMAELIARRCGLEVPGWARSPRRILRDPWFAEESSGPEARIIALRDSPSAFKKRNLYAAAVDLPLRLRAGLRDTRRSNCGAPTPNASVASASAGPSSSSCSAAPSARCSRD